MPADAFDDASWSRALTLAERAALRPGLTVSDLTTEERVRGERRLRRWSSEPQFRSAETFRRRLASDGLTEEALTALLGESAERLRARTYGAPDWLVALDDAYKEPGLPPLDPQPSLPETPTGAFVRAILPLINRARRRVQEGAHEIAARYPTVPFDPETVDLTLFDGLAEELDGLLAKTLVLELHIAQLSGTLPQPTPAARMAAYQERLCQPAELLALLREYPMLARLLVRRLDQWASSSVEFVERLAADWPTLRERYGPWQDAPETDRLVGVDGGLGDRHRGGRSVLLLRFASGLRLVYKPRSLAVEAHMQELLGWLNAHGSHPPFRTLAVLDRGEHGWVEWVDSADCLTQEAVARFYERQGAQLALLHALEATDFHYENVVAAGEQPVLLDLETLFSPVLQRGTSAPARTPLDRVVHDSILRVGLIGWRVGASTESAGLDISGLSASGGQVLPGAAETWEESGDGLRIARKGAVLGESRNRPTLGGQKVDPLDFVTDFERGFRAMYELLERHRAELLAEDGPLARFANDTVRVIVRPTQTYMTLLQATIHPDALRDALEQDRLFDRLWTRTDERPTLAVLTPLEQADLRQGDVPLLTTRVDSRDIVNGAGNIAPGLIDQTGLETVSRRLRAMGPADLERQVGLVRAAFATLAPADRPNPWPAPALPPLPIFSLRERYLTAASSVGDRLLSLAQRDESGIAWLGLVMPYPDIWAVEPLWSDLYDGLPGVGLFLAYLGRATGQQRYTDAAHAVLATLRPLLPAAGDGLRTIGAYTGVGGLVYTLTHLAALWDRTDLLDEAERLTDQITERVSQDDQLDLVGGAAGAILALLTLQQARPRAATLTAAIRCGEHLLDRATDVTGGLGWVGKIAAEAPLAGFAHGAAGIATALLELAAASGQARFRRAGDGALAYERTLLDPVRGTWRDLRAARFGDDSPHTYWCYGAPGIGLSRLRTLPLLNDPSMRGEIDLAVRTTVALGPSGSHSLCHGTLGNVDLLLEAATVLGDQRLRTKADDLAAHVLDQAEREGWRCATPLSVETPGLMNGLAGIGYEFLRLADPAGVPSVLALEGPRRMVA